MLLLSLLLSILCAVACYALGVPKGYGGAICGVAGFFGGILAIIIIALLPDKSEEKYRAEVKQSNQDKEISELKRRIAELESSKTIEPQKEESAVSDVAAESSADAAAANTAKFPSRTEENIACPRCGKRQRGNRDACYSCGTLFQYENEI